MPKVRRNEARVAGTWSLSVPVAGRVPVKADAAPYADELESYMSRRFRQGCCGRLPMLHRGDRKRWDHHQGIEIAVGLSWDEQRSTATSQAMFACKLISDLFFS